ncbi:hypothetical protein [Shewanella carassii]|uniref:Uncharacterized protein n=1 Tax=Shewanella carassii TaxID=1987584 RepID=A0ABQ1T1W7_9GAMM|nr:hypothetical protein [Shewanella carassii]GGE79584.1 hypothetical protein GCM10011520_20200 [Shewanella carassii]
MTGTEIIGLVASIVSLIIGGFAIWLSVTFYKMSTKNTQDLERASSNINSTVTRLEVLFEKLYADTFGMMKDTVTDMRNHVWNSSDFSRSDKTEIENSFVKLKEEINESIEALISSHGDSKKQVSAIAEQIENLVSEKIDHTAKEQSEKSWKEKEKIILSTLAKHGPMTTGNIRRLPGLEEDEAASMLFILRKNNEVIWDGSPEMFDSETIVRLPKKV